MYLQITTRCNMTCAHCAYSCTKDGEDMSLDTFRASLPHLEDQYITIGGGEPTLHPYFEQILLECISVCTDEGGVCVITNGSHRRRSMLIAGLAEKRVMQSELSRDDFHDEIDYAVVDRFEKQNGYKRIRNTTRHHEPKAQGRGIEYMGYEPDDELPTYPSSSGCICDTLFIRPDGDVVQCGCNDAPILGDVFKGFEIYGDLNTCWKDRETFDALVEAGLVA